MNKTVMDEPRAGLRALDQGRNSQEALTALCPGFPPAVLRALLWILRDDEGTCK